MNRLNTLVNEIFHYIYTGSSYICLYFTTSPSNYSSFSFKELILLVIFAFGAGVGTTVLINKKR